MCLLLQFGGYGAIDGKLTQQTHRLIAQLAQADGAAVATAIVQLHLLQLRRVARHDRAIGGGVERTTIIKLVVVVHEVVCQLRGQQRGA